MTSVIEIQFEIAAKFSMQIPDGARLLSVGLRNGKPTLWCHVRQNNEMQKRNFIAVKNGKLIENEDVSYVGTIQIQSGLSIWHIFEELPFENPNPVLATAIDSEKAA